MNGINETFQAYQHLSPTDEKIVFRDVMRRLYAPIIHNWGILSEKPLIKPEDEYIKAFDLSVRDVIDHIGTLEYQAMIMLAEGGVFSDLRKVHAEYHSKYFRINKPLVYRFAFKVANKEVFIDLYEQIFDEDEQINPRTALDYNEMEGVLRVRKSGNTLVKVQYGKKPDLILREIFKKGEDIVRKDGFTADVIRDDEKMKHILKHKVYTSFLTIGSDYVRLKPRVSRKELEKYTK